MTERTGQENPIVPAGSEELFKLLFNKADDAIYLYEITTDGIPGLFIEVNESACRRLGYTHDDLLGMSPGDIYSQGTSSESSDIWQDLLKLGKVTGEMICVSKIGTRIPVEINSHLFSLEGRSVVLSVARDISGRKQMEEDLKRSNEELKRLAGELGRSNAELENFAYIASHDLQEPLRMVASYIQLLAQRYGGQLGADADDFITYAMDGAYRMKTMINDLLTYSRVGTRGSDFKPVDCETVLKQTLKNLQLAITDTAADITHDSLPVITGDQSQLVMLFQNLINNSIRYRSDEALHIHLSAERGDTEWVLGVKDNGIGLDTKHADRIFSIFQRLHSRTEYAGTGIGLALCKKIVERHGGRIWVESEPERGAVFFFTFPLRGDAEKSSETERDEPDR